MPMLKNLQPKNKLYSLLLILLFFQIYFLSSVFYSPQSPLQPLEPSTRCEGGLVFVYDLPPAFNSELLLKCHDQGPWNNSRCDALSNGGFGSTEGLAPSWYWTDMFTGDVVYHTRIMKHKCRTAEPESATAFYIPFYAGVVAGKALFSNGTARNRDRQFEELVTWLKDQPPWRRSNGSDHFIHLGRSLWDFRRLRHDEGWGISFINMPGMEQIMRLTVETDARDHLDISVPYPTGFHPKSKLEVDQWLHFVTNRKRTSLFTFVGATRNVKGDFRSILLSHCYNESGSCRLVDCSISQCYAGTSEIQEAFLDSDFCLQPKGDTYTRKSTFDCMLAGSIPVFFWRESIERQYQWFLGDEPDRFSVFVDRKDVRNGTSIRKVLEGYSREKVRRLREKVISLIPNFIYGDGSGSGKDAFDISIDGVLNKIKDQNRSNMGLKPFLVKS